MDTNDKIVVGIIFGMGYIVISCVHYMYLTETQNNPISKNIFLTILWPLFAVKALIYHSIRGLYSACEQLICDWEY